MKPSNPDEQDWDASRNRIIGLGERSVHKNYYPALRRNMADLQKLMLAIEQTTVGVVICNLESIIEFVNPAMCAMTGFTMEELVGKTPRLYRSAATTMETYRGMWALLQAGQPWRGELLNRRKNGGTYWIRLSVTPIRDDTGTVTHFVGINEDITERKQAEERQKLLVDELNHRVKNTLAVAQAIASQTLRTAKTPQAFCQEFEGRLMTLSQAHNLLNRSAWTGAPLHGVLSQELAPYAAEESGRVTLSGDELEVTPNAAVTLSMAFHELATNAAKYGAFAAPTGRVEVNWAMDGQRFHLIWQERAGPLVQAPSRKGFGMTLLERGLAHQLGGTVQLSFPPDGMCCVMDLPLDRLKAHGNGE